MPSNGTIEIDTDRVKVLGCPACGASIQVEHLEPFTLIRCPQCQHEVRVPAQLGQFLLIKELGRGAMGAVYEGYDSTLKRLVAIKVMQKKLGDDKEFVDKFLGEAQALAALNDVNIVQIYSCGQEKGQPYIVMEFIDGGRVDQMMKDRGCIDEVLGLSIAHDVTHGLYAASKIGLVHGDIKGENMLRDRDENTKVVDFGLARFTGQKTEKGAVWGTPFYIAPEVIQGSPPDQKADIYSLGATLFHLMTGQPPFNGKTTKEVLLARLQAPAPDIRTVKDTIHKETATLIARMLEADPFRRYPNYGSLIADLEETMNAVKPKETVHHHHKKKQKRPGATLMIAAIAIMLTIAGGAFILLQHNKEKNKPRTVPSGPTVTRLINGKLVTVAASSKKGPGGQKKVVVETKKGPITTKDGKGADTYIQGTKGNALPENFGTKPQLWIKAGNNVSLHLVRKTYLKFDISDCEKKPVKDAELVLTVCGGGKNGKKGAYQLMLWGLRNEGPWEEGGDGLDILSEEITWENAPGNDKMRAGKMGSDAVLLMQLPIEANPETGQRISFKNAMSVSQNALINYINDRKGNLISFMITGDENNNQRAGWKFASKEHTFLDAPKLILDRQE